MGTLAADLRETGETVPLSEIEIALAALAAGAAVWTRDSGFERIARVAGGLELKPP